MALSDTDYVSGLALTDVCNAGVNYTIAANANLAVDNRGMNQGALYTLLNNVATNWNLLMAKLEADGAASTTYTPNNLLTTLASQGYGLTNKGMHQKDLINQLSEMESKFNAVVALLDADTGVTLTDYATVTSAVGTGAALNLNDTVIGSYGLDQAKLVSFLDDYIAKFNALLGNLDIDAL